MFCPHILSYFPFYKQPQTTLFPPSPSFLLLAFPFTHDQLCFMILTEVKSFKLKTLHPRAKIVQSFSGRTAQLSIVSL